MVSRSFGSGDSTVTCQENAFQINAPAAASAIMHKDANETGAPSQLEKEGMSETTHGVAELKDYVRSPLIC